MPVSEAVPQASVSGASPVLTDRVAEALFTSPYVPSTRVRIEAGDGSVRLHGCVGTFFEKQMAQEVVRRLDGVERVENLLQVSWG
ncbi:MAG: BON domain-containing protein [Planctomycetota bacterium]